MWQLNNTTPFAAESSWIRNEGGAEVWIVVVKASFLVDPLTGELSIEEDQPAVSLSADHMGDAGKSSLLEDDHFVLSKAGTDVLLNGSAYTLPGQLTNEVEVALVVGDTEKRLRVFGDRRWEHAYGGVSLSPALTFTRMPITYERAFGGMDLSWSTDNQCRDDYRQNPIGCGYSRTKEGLLGTLGPNIEYSGALIKRWSDKPAPAGFGAIPCEWEPRVNFSGTYDEKWMQERHPLLPLDTDPRWNHQAPADQQCGKFLSGGERVSLYNLIPPEKSANCQLHFELPRMRLGFRTLFKNSIEHHVAKLHTVLLTPDDLRVSLIWHTSLECHNRDHLLENTTIFSKELLHA